MHSVQTLLRNALCELRGNLLGIKDTWAHPFTPLLSVAKVWTERISDLTALITTLCDQMGPILWGGWKRIYMRGGNRNSIGTAPPLTLKWTSIRCPSLGLDFTCWYLLHILENVSFSQRYSLQFEADAVAWKPTTIDRPFSRGKIFSSCKLPPSV